MKTLFHTTLGLMLFMFFPLQSFAAEFRVLCYHTFLDKEKVSTDFSVQQFKSHIEKLELAGFRYISWEDVQNGTIQGNNNILITIDDGHRTVYPVVKDFLLRKGIKPVLSIYPGVIGGKNYLSWEQLRELSDAGCTIASHGYYHHFLSQKFVSKDRLENNSKLLNTEIFKSKAVLETKLQREVDIFVYGGGVNCQEAEELIKKAGYRYAFKISAGPIQFPLAQNKNSYELNRYMMTKEIAEPYIKRIMAQPKN